jgi:flagellar hook-length control protein FliK
MNIEITNLSPIASSVAAPSTAPISGIVENVSTPPTDTGVIPEGFSGALVAQIELLSNIKTESAVPLQTSEPAVLQGANAALSVTGGLPVGKTDTQDFAALLGNDLPPTYKTKDDVDHAAALAAVTDTLKYITLGTSAGEKAAEAAQNVKDVIAMTVPAQQNVKDMTAMVVPTQQNIKNVVAMAVPIVQNAQNQNVVKKTVPVEQSTETVVPTVAEQSLKDAPVQMDLGQSNEKPEKDKQSESQAQIATVADTRAAEELPAAATVILPSVMPVEQVKPVNNLAPSNAIPSNVIKEDGAPSFIKTATENAKPSQMTKASGGVLQGEVVFRQPDQSNQDFNVKYFGNAGQSEKTGQVVEQQVLNLNIDGEKTLPRIGTDAIQPNKPVVDSKVDVKADVPAITKPLSHPEWSKDVGERIVWMSSKAIPSAEIRLNPQHLGPISIRVDVTDDKATVAFTAQHAVVRETLEASIPKLREMMSAQNLNLVEVNVSQGSASDQGRSQAQNFAQTSGRGQGMVDGVIDGVDDVEQEIESGRAVVSKGLLSLYA